MNRTAIDLFQALHCGKRSFTAVNLTLNVSKTSAFWRPLRTSQTATIRSFSTTSTIQTGPKQDQQDLSTTFVSPFGSNQQLSKRKQFKQITPDRHLVNYLDTHQLGYCAKRKVPITLPPLDIYLMHPADMYSRYCVNVRLESHWRESFNRSIIPRPQFMHLAVDTEEKQWTYRGKKTKRNGTKTLDSVR